MNDDFHNQQPNKIRKIEIRKKVKVANKEKN